MSGFVEHGRAPAAQGLYDPAHERDACGMGFITHVHGVKSRALVAGALELLGNMAHRGATAGPGATGDGAGILLQLPHAFLRTACRLERIPLPESGDYGVGMAFLPALPELRRAVVARIEAIAASFGCRVLGWRDVPIDTTVLSGVARSTLPAIRQLFVAPSAVLPCADDPMAFERSLYVIRRAVEQELTADNGLPYFASLSSRTIVYKGLLRPSQLAAFYRDLASPDLASGIALVHSRFSTNTFPSWSGAHPFRMLCHNGEINTLRGNLNWMRAREPELASPKFGDDVRRLLPLVRPGQSDSASLDNVLELLVQAGRPLAQSIAMLVPEAWQSDPGMPDDRRAFYAYHASLIEPWDGPAALAFTDGRQVGAIQDRNGLRPARWLVTEDDWVILASEAGALRVDPDRVREKGRLQPGKMLLVNTTQGRLLHDAEVKAELSSLRPYRRWLTDERVELDRVIERRRAEGSAAGVEREIEPAHLKRVQRLFGYTRDEIAMVLGPMAVNGEEPVGSMGNDAPLAIFSDRPQLLYSYFRQLFAQVTNPAIDPIREQLVMSLRTRLGAQRNLLEETPDHARQIEIAHPVLTGEAIDALRSIAAASVRAITLPALFSARGGDGLAPALDALTAAARAAVDRGYAVLILSDRDADAIRAPIPSLLATAAVHHTLVRSGVRARASIVVETGDAREVSHLALLFSYGAAAVHPYLALETCAAIAREHGTDALEAQRHYVKAVEKGLLKVLSKLGISTMQSYCGAQNWEAIGLGAEVIDRYFSGTSSRLGGIGLADVARDVMARHHAAHAANDDSLLEDAGEYHVRAGGERHAWSPHAIATLQRAARERSWESYEAFSRAVNNEQRAPTTLRGMLDFAESAPVPLDDVESASAIVKRFVTGAMSFGSISREAHEALAVAMNEIGGRSNTGEGGEDPERFGTDRNSAIKQVASARFGVTAAYLVNAAELQIKVSQGAKPGEGGQLPGHKVDATIAATRHATPGVTLISPPPHHDIYSIEDLKQLIFDLRQVNPGASVSVKLVAEAGVGPVAAGVVKAGADLVTISGDSGGTGAAPLSSIKRAGAPWELGIAEAQQTLLLNNLRSQVRLQADGQLKTGRDVVIAALLGADEFGFATAPLIVEGCVMMRKCHLNTCPVGIATQDPVLRAKFAGKPEHLVNYFYFVAEEARRIMARLGFRTMAEMIGRTDMLVPRKDIASAKAASLDLAPLLHAARIATDERNGPSDRAVVDPMSRLNRELVTVVAPALDLGVPLRIALPVRNTDRALGAGVAGEIARRFGPDGMSPGAVTIRCHGSAGQSFGAFAPRGLTLELEGESNDYIGKGLCGGRIVVSPARTERLLADGTVIVGNTALYGATAGEVFIAGAAGERFAVRNSGATAVVEGLGDHGCEYMTGGTVVVLGTIGRNFAAGMSGGTAYVLRDEKHAPRIHAPDTFEIATLADTGDVSLVHALIEQHARLTGSRRAKATLAHWPQTIRSLVRLTPLEYRNALARSAAEQRAAREEGTRYG